MNKIEITKNVVNLVVGLGTTTIVKSIIKNNTTQETVTDQVTVAAGSLVLGSMAVDATKQHTDAKIEEIAVWWNHHITKN